MPALRFPEALDGTSYGPFTVASGPAGPAGPAGADGRWRLMTIVGPAGSDGGPGPQGQPGEVSNQQLNNAIAGTSANTNAIQLLGLTVSDPPTQSELQAVANKMDELIQAMRR